MTQAIPEMLRSRNPLHWLQVFGPGAIMASLTIGTGELIFSSRGGAIFGYSILWIFLSILVLKWVLVFSTARHLVLSGAHPFERSLELPGPRGWFPLLFLIPAIGCFPIWVGFHAGVMGTLIQELSSGGGLISGGIDKHIGGGIVLGLILVVVFMGGYRALEKVQIFIVTTMLACVALSMVLMNPDWLEVLEGLLVPRGLRYPDWLASEYPRLASTPLWVETVTYVGVIGGASYDYLAYVSFLREKRWGLSGEAPASPATLEEIARDPRHPVRSWVRAPLIDCTLSFVIVLVFSAVFVISGKLVLGLEHKIPNADNLLNLQAEFVTRLHHWLYPLYIIGALLAMAGTLYGTIEVAPAIIRELFRAFNPTMVEARKKQLRTLTVTWCALGALGVLTWSSILSSGGTAAARPPTLVEIVRPAGLFTGVFSCAFVCFMSPWMDRCFLPHSLRMGSILTVLNILAGTVFLGVGLKSFWDYGASRADNGVLGGLVTLAIVLAIFPGAWCLAWGCRKFSSR